MDEINRLDLLTLIVALSVYVATIRLVVLGRLTAEPAPSKWRKDRYKVLLVALVPGDALLVVSGAFLFLQIFWADLFGGAAPGWFEASTVWTFFAAGAWLVLLHGVVWARSPRHLPLVWEALRRWRSDRRAAPPWGDPLDEAMREI
jgi:hypothetical protein